MLDMPEFYDHVEAGLEAEMRFLNKLWKAKLERDRKDKAGTETYKDNKDIELKRNERHQVTP